MVRSVGPRMEPSATLALSGYSHEESDITILSNTTVRRSPVDQEELKSYLKSENKQHFSR